MFDEKAFLAQVESADVDRFAGLVTRPSVEEEKALVRYFGEERYNRLHDMALRRSARGVAARARRNVVVIHGIMGAELTATDRGGERDRIWLHLLRLASGASERLRLDEDGLEPHDPGFDVHASGILKRHYGELLLYLSLNRAVRAFWFDWRKDLKLAAAELETKLASWFGPTAPVDLVAHSMGGLVARTFIARYPRRWKAMGAEGGGRLVMLGTPNHGSFAIPQVLTGLDSTVAKLALLDLRHGKRDLLEILNSFVGTYEMLPSPLLDPSLEKLYRAESWGELNLSQRHLDTARAHHELLSPVVDPDRMSYIAGYDQPTLSGVDVGRMPALELDAYEVTLDGDGRVPHVLGHLVDGDVPVPRYFVRESHGALPSNPQVLRAIEELLATGKTTELPETLGDRGRSPRDAREARARLIEARSHEMERLSTLIGRLELEGVKRSSRVAVVSHEREAEELVVASFLGDSPGEAPAPSAEGPIPVVRVHLRHAGIEDPPEAGRSALPIDAIAVGHYSDVSPGGAELDLDRVISPGGGRRRRGASGAGDAPLLLTEYTQRGILRGRLGEPFFLPDPRDSTPTRVVAVAGMGVPGRFGVPELTVLARELVWSLGRLGKRHLATVVIGAGNGNLDPSEAVDAWMRGVKHAVTGAADDGRHVLQEITFVEHDARRMRLLDAALIAVCDRMAGRMTIEYEPLGDAALEELGRKARDADRAAAEARLGLEEPAQAPIDRPPTRITLSLQGNTYRFGAITQGASIPERTVPLDPDLVLRANDELAAEVDPDLQRERGTFLSQLLFPRDLAGQLAEETPLVMLLDGTTARIHWEMLARAVDGTPGGSATGAGDAHDAFLGTSRGLTRQLRTTFAPPPEPPPPPRRQVRVLVVADPAEDAPLPGAEEEGVEVADLFERFNSVHSQGVNGVEVVRLFGPRRATRTTTLRHLMLRTYDVLHFAGHCVYQADDPIRSGWIFSNGERLTAHELQRVDRIPKFVFSNACESGITLDQRELRSNDLAPTFAESFFARGVSNFVCTAWPVSDLAARTFATALYSRLLGVPLEGEEDDATAREPRQMHRAMRDARRRIFETDDGRRTWGAYQHYGNPHFRLFGATLPAEAPLATSRGQRFKRRRAPDGRGSPSGAGAAQRATAADRPRRAGR